VDVAGDVAELEATLEGLKSDHDPGNDRDAAERRTGRWTKVQSTIRSAHSRSGRRPLS
jgi:hypothetical protein